jgi:hypothetical protein
MSPFLLAVIFYPLFGQPKVHYDASGNWELGLVAIMVVGAIIGIILLLAFIVQRWIAKKRK